MWWARRPSALLRYGLSHRHEQDQHVLSSLFTPMQGRAGVYQKLAYPPASPPSPFIHFLQNARASGSCPVTQV